MRLKENVLPQALELANESPNDSSKGTHSDARKSKIGEGVRRSCAKRNVDVSEPIARKKETMMMPIKEDIYVMINRDDIQN